jgi:hypothetical protein
MTHSPDIVIIGAGIAGLWTFNRLKRMGYDVLLLESKAIGCGQTIASQGIIHSGLKYAFAGQINALAKSISAMPNLWRDALDGNGPVDLSAARLNASSQYLFVPKGLMGGLVKLVTKKALGNDVQDIAQNEWPADIQQSGFKGSVIYMDEPILDVPSVLEALAKPYQDSIRLIDTPDDPIGFLKKHNIVPRKIIFTSAASNHAAAKLYGDDKGLKTQTRPLLMGMIQNAPFELNAHCVGKSDKPVVSITSHKMRDGSLVWYLGGGVAERAKDSDPSEVYKAAKDAIAKYMPGVDMSEFEWATLPIDRIEGKSNTEGWMPDTPTVHHCGDVLYCWPTKLTFAPLLSDTIVKHLNEEEIKPSMKEGDYSSLPPVSFANTPWDDATWIKDS